MIILLFYFSNVFSFLDYSFNINPTLSYHSKTHTDFGIVFDYTNLFMKYSVGYYYNEKGEVSISLPLIFLDLGIGRNFYRDRTFIHIFCYLKNPFSFDIQNQNEPSFNLNYQFYFGEEKMHRIGFSYSINIFYKTIFNF